MMASVVVPPRQGAEVSEGKLDQDGGGREGAGGEALAPLTREAAHAEYLASIERYREGAGYRIPGEFVIVRGESYCREVS